MLRRIIAAIVFAIIFYAATSPSQARPITHKFSRHLIWRHHQHHHRHLAMHHRHPRHVSGRPGCFYAAASMGGPCGCWAAAMLLHIEAHVWHGINLWLADDWRKFEHVPPAQANAAIWPHRHVAPIVPGTYDGKSIVVHDSWRTHRVRTAGLIFVQTSPRSRRPGISYNSGTPL